MNNKLSFKNEISRKLLHLTALIIPAAYLKINNLFFVNSFISVLFLSIIFLELMKKNNTSIWQTFNSYFKPFIRKYEYKKPMGSSYMIFSFFLIILFFNKTIVATSMFITIISDALAAIIGLRYGKLKTINNKTLEGSYAFLISTIIILFISTTSLSLYVIIIISIIITAIEAFTPMEYDNLTVPIFSAIILTLVI